MAASEMWDFLDTVVADYETTTLTIVQQGMIDEVSKKNHVIHYGVDGSEERIAFGTTKIYYVSWGWNILTEANSGTIFDLYNDPDKANGCTKSFYLSHGDGHTYAVRFDCDLTRRGNSVTRYGLPGITVKVLGRYVPYLSVSKTETITNKDSRTVSLP